MAFLTTFLPSPVTGAQGGYKSSHWCCSNRRLLWATNASNRGGKKLLLFLLNNQLLFKGTSNRCGAELWSNITADHQSTQSTASWRHVCTAFRLRYSKIEKNVACQFEKKNKNVDFLCTEEIKLNVQIVFSLRDLGSISSRPHNRRQHAAVPAWDLYIRFFTCMNVRDSPPGQLMWLRSPRISTQTVRGCLRSAHLSAGRPHGALELTEGYYPESANAYYYRNLTFQTDL